MNEEGGGKVNNRYTLRNRERNNQAREEEENDEAEELGSDGEEEKVEIGRDDVLMRHSTRILLKRIRMKMGWKCQDI